MNWYYAVGTERQGPVAQEEFDRLVQQGVITPATMVWREGMADWQPYSQQQAPPPAGRPAAGMLCGGCGQSFAPENVVSLGGAFFCAACKPAAVQRMKEGVSLHSPEAEATRKEYLNHEASIRSVGFLYCLGGFAVVLLGLGAGIGGFASKGGDGAIVGMVVGVLLCLLGVGQFMVGRGLRKLLPWTRTPTAILSGFGLLGFPVGTLVNGYILYLVLSQKGRMVLSKEYADVVAQTPHIVYKTSIVVKILVGLVLLLILFGVLAAVFSSAKR